MSEYAACALARIVAYVDRWIVGVLKACLTRVTHRYMAALPRIPKEEPCWKLGPWDVGAGVFKGFGLGFTVQPGEWDVTLGPFSIGGVRE